VKFKKGEIKNEIFFPKKAGLTQTPETQPHKFNPQHPKPET